MKVSVVPVDVKKGQICSIYKLMMKLHKPKHYPEYTDVTLEYWEETLRVGFVRELEDAIESHITLLKKVSGITNFELFKLLNSKNVGLAQAWTYYWLRLLKEQLRRFVSRTLERLANAKLFFYIRLNKKAEYKRAGETNNQTH